jgi:hypothetical protein
MNELENVNELGIWEAFQVVARGLCQTGENKENHRFSYKQNVNYISMSFAIKTLIIKHQLQYDRTLSWVRAPLYRNVFVRFNYSNQTSQDLIKERV